MPTLFLLVGGKPGRDKSSEYLEDVLLPPFVNLLSLGSSSQPSFSNHKIGFLPVFFPPERVALRGW